jgi:outer membrane murein-binding lipoprotein Lpp
MLESTETQVNPLINPTGHPAHDRIPTPTDPTLSRYPAFNQPTSKQFAWKPYAIGAVVAALCLFIGYQQTEINRLSRDVGTLTNDMKTSDVPMRIDNLDDKLDEVNNRLSYLDSKISATDQKAQAALDELKAKEKAGNVVGNFLNNLGKSLGLNQ